MEDGRLCLTDLVGYLLKLNNAKTKEVQVSRPSWEEDLEDPD